MGDVKGLMDKMQKFLDSDEGKAEAAKNKGMIVAFVVNHKKWQENCTKSSKNSIFYFISPTKIS